MQPTIYSICGVILKHRCPGRRHPLRTMRHLHRAGK